MGRLSFLADLLRHNKASILVLLLFCGAAVGGVFYDQINVDNIQIDGNSISSTNTNGDIVLDPNGTGGVQFTDLTATTVPYLDANKELVSSLVTPTELGYLDGVTSAIQTQLDAKASTTDLNNHLNDTTDAHAASAITNTPSGNLAGTDVQTALDELQSDIDTRALDSDLGAHTAATTSVHGITDTSDLVTLDGSETLTNKTLTSPVIDGLLDFEQKLSDPDISPVSGALWLYAKDDKLYTKNNSGTVTEVGSGGSGDSTAKNFYEDPSADEYTNTNYITTYDDGAATPTDGDGGTVDSVSVSFDNMSGTGIDGNSYYLQKAAEDAQGEGWVLKTTRTLSEQAKGAQLFEVKFWYRTSADYEDGDVTVWLFREGSDTLETCHGKNFLSNNVSNDLIAALDTGKPAWHSCSTTLSDSDTAVHLLLHVATTNADAYNITVDDIFMGTGNLGVSGPIETDWESFTPTVTGASANPSSVSGSISWRRVGPDMLINGTVTITTIGSGSGSVILDIPAGKSVDTSVVTGSSGRPVLGTYNTFGDTEHGNISLTSTSSPTKLYFSKQGSSGNFLAFADLDDGDTLQIKARIPISGWDTGSNIVSSTQDDFQNAQVLLTSDDQPAIGTSATKITFNNVVKDTHGLYSSGTFTAPVSGEYDVIGHLVTDSETWTANQRVLIQAVIGGSNSKYLGVGRAIAGGTANMEIPISATVTLEAGQAFEIWGTSSVATNLFNSAALNHISIKYAGPTRSVIGAAGVPDEDYEATFPLAAFPHAADTWDDLLSITLPQGKWKLSGLAEYIGVGGTTSTTNVYIAISENESSNADHVTGYNRAAQTKSTASGALNSVAVPEVIVTVNEASKTYYLQGRADSSTTNLRVSASLKAVRRR